MNKRPIPPALAILALLYTVAAGALSSDKDQPIHIEADRADLDERRGISVYRGGVVMTRGTLRITGDEITLYVRDDTVRKAVAVGTPATYRQRPDGREEDIRAEARRMEYHAEQNKVILLGGALLQQGGNMFRSERIEYDLARDVVNAGGGTGNERVRVIIQPRERGERDIPSGREGDGP